MNDYREYFDLIRPRVSYNPITGSLTWCNHRLPALNGKSVGWPTPQGYLRMNLYDGEHKKAVCMIHAHNLIWYIHYGECVPEGMTIDHRDGDGMNNRISNLRLATPKQQKWNRGGLRSDTASGFRGVFRNHGKWRVRYQGGGKKIHLGTFECKYEAAICYVSYCHDHHGEFWSGLREFGSLELCIQEILRLKGREN